MSTIPKNMEIIEDQTKLELSTGVTEINYILGVPQNPIDTPPPVPVNPDEDYTLPMIVGGIIAAGVAGASIIIKKNKSKSSQSTIQTDIISDKPTDEKFVEPQAIFDFRPDMREDDKKIVNFISESGGQVFESDLRKKFLQPYVESCKTIRKIRSN
jgi:hypothetical protein